MKVSLRGVFSWRERWSLWLAFQQVMAEASRQSQADQRRLNALLMARRGVCRRVLNVRLVHEDLRVEHADGLVLRMRGVQETARDRLLAAAARHRVELVHGSVREAIFEVSDSTNRRTVMHVEAARIEREV